MGLWRYSVLWYLGGMAYTGMELLWRGWSHSSMFAAGGTCFLLIGHLGELEKPLPLAWRSLAGAGIVTTVELAAGLLVNRNYQVWNYSAMPGNFLGQICLPFTLLWVPVSLAIGLILAAFLLVTVLVGGKTGAKSILGLAMTVAVLVLLLIPLLLKGWPTVWTVFLLCSYIAVVCFVILGGVNRKILCACLGTIAGMALATVFGLGAQALAHVNGLRISDVEPLLQLRQTGTPIGLRGLLVGGIIISSLGAVMDVAMSISSALSELKAVNPEMTLGELWKSGRNIGRDMVGTMTNTLILAFLGSGFTLMIYLYSLDLPWRELMSSSYLALEVVSGVSSAIGVILAVPVTTIIGALLLSRKQ